MEKSMERKALEQKLTGFFEELHMHPELSYEEYETTERIKRELAAAGIEILQIPLKTGVTAIVRGAKPGKTYGLRCDIDALPIEEETDLPYKSKTPGKMHACGHDFHTAAVFGAALLLQERKEELQGTVKILFQPAEESSHGAETVLETGVLSDVTAIFGLHTAAYLPVGTLGIRAGSVMAAVDRFELNITGTGCHGGHPDEGVDTILVAASVIQAFQSIVGRNLNPFHTGVVSVTRINGGNTWNVIPDKVELEGTVRSMEKDDRIFIERRMREIAEHTAAAYGANAELLWYPGPPATVNEKAWSAFAQKVAEESGFEVVPQRNSTGGEDFAFYLEKIPGCFINVGTGVGYPNHHPKFYADEAALTPAAEYLEKLLVEALRQ
ncbi:MAG: amidohydrolase [Roseburia sp.]|jgi:amidohydrolase|uniref:Amidohydrolase n=2 Tax=Roseburia intestinalis TaxID=166486 RepID=D4KVI1_9FIRM|nr:amidohydrolase [Roseburia intestinalis]MBP8833750.1 amidohydrolase [Roseburia sp.]OLA56170.1 MAG: hydrolase [Roseburia intestinalis]CBL11371.1 amidohydrolase [Roseburia intestinalis XB6B4]